MNITNDNSIVKRFRTFLISHDLGNSRRLQLVPYKLNLQKQKKSNENRKNIFDTEVHIDIFLNLDL